MLSLMRAIWAVGFSACLLAGRVSAHELSGLVVAIHDGDTITVLDAQKKQHKVRLEGIDAPESHQAFGTRAKEALGKKLHEQQLHVDWDETDKYGRILGHVFVGERNINRELVAEGWAWHFVKYSNDPALAAAEKSARQHRLGLWSGPNPLPPWDFRNSPELAEKSVEQPAQAGTVYVTKTGTKYHRAGCRHLTDSARAIPLTEAMRSLQPCKNCKPPQ